MNNLTVKQASELKALTYKALISAAQESMHNECYKDDQSPEMIPESMVKKYVNDRFQAEYGHEIKRYGFRKAAENWLQGLALPIEFYTNAIHEDFAQPLNIEIEACDFDDIYWSYMAEALYTVCVSQLNLQPFAK